MDVKKQYGVIPYLNGKKNGQKIVLVTSKTNGYWIFPKGNLVKKKNKFQSAAQEAFEEAGVRGKINEDISYTIEFQHSETTHKITLFPMKVETVLDEWPEMNDRKRKVVSVSKAMDLITLDDLRNCLISWQEDFL